MVFCGVLDKKTNVCVKEEEEKFKPEKSDQFIQINS